MNILHVILSMDPAAGGPPAVVARLAAAQAAAGHGVGVLSYAAPHAATAIDASLARIPFAGQVQWHTVAPVGSRLVDRFVASAARAWLGDHLAGGGTPDVLHLHGVWDPILKAAADVARRRDVPYVIAPHGMLDPWSLGQSRLKKRVALALGYRRMLDRAGALHALNGDERDLLAPLRLACPIEVIPNGVFLEELSPRPPAGSFHASHPDLCGAPYVLFLSRLHYKKGLDYLAVAFSHVAAADSGVHLVVAGPDDGARAAFEADVRRLGVADRVHLVGPLYGADKVAALGDATCFVLPSRQEGFSMAITEALALGVPGVISPECHFPEVAAVGAGRIVPLDPVAIAAAVTEILARPDLARQMGDAGRQLVASKYTWQQIAARADSVYTRVVARRSARPEVARS